MSRRNKNKRRLNTPPGQRQERSHEPLYRYTEPPRSRVTDGSKISITDMLSPEPTPPPSPPPPPLLPGADETDTTPPEGGSRGNAVRDALRSRILFPEAMFRQITERADAVSAQLGLSTPLELYLAWEYSRGSVQSQLSEELLILNRSLAAQRAASERWSADRRDQADRLWARIKTVPYRVARKLGRTKYGTLLLIEKLTSLGEAAEKNGCLDDEQISMLFDVMGLDRVLRNGSQKVGAPSDGPGLADVIRKEIAQHEANLERSLNAQDRLEAQAAELGIVRYYDEETLRLRSDRARADRRASWSWDTLMLLKKGIDASTIIDPETKKPVVPGPRPGVAPQRKRAATPPPSASPAPPEDPPAPAPQAQAPAQAAEDTPSSPPPDLPWLPEGFPEESRESLMILAETLRQARAAADAATNPFDPPPPSL